MTERFGLVPAEWAELGVVSIEPGGVSGKIAFLGAHLVDVACDELPKAHG